MWLYLYHQADNPLLINTALIRDLCSTDEEYSDRTFWTIRVWYAFDRSCLKLTYATKEKRDQYYKALLAKLNPEHLLLDD